MKLSSFQAQILFDIFKWSVGVSGGIVGYSQKSREELTNTILNQQDKNLVDLETEGNVDDKG